MNTSPPKTIEGMRQLAMSREGLCLSDTYKTTRLTWRCGHGHEWRAEPCRVIRGSWCPVCARLQRRNGLGTAQRIAKERGGLCLSTHYQSSKNHMDWQCTHGHHWRATFASIQRGSWCPTCNRLNRSDTLEQMQQIAAQRGGRCLSERYINGATALSWECAQGHRWEAIPSSVKKRSWCRLCAIQACSNTLEQAQAIAEKRGGQCLSSCYVNAATPLTWRCARDHVWDAPPSNVLQGSWCRQCYYDSMRNNIKNMQSMALARGGQCLSQHYVDSTTKLRWQCSVGHSWEAIPHSITQGHWCPSCVFMARCRNEHKRRKYQTT